MFQSPHGPAVWCYREELLYSSLAADEDHLGEDIRDALGTWLFALSRCIILTHLGIPLLQQFQTEVLCLT